jgi:hypothetical protein
LFQDILRLIAGLRTQGRREVFDVMRSRATDGRPAKSATREGIGL